MGLSNNLSQTSVMKLVVHDRFKPCCLWACGFESRTDYNVLSSNWLGNKILTLEIGVRSSTG